MKNYILENGMNIEGFNTKEEAIKAANYFWNRLTEKEKKTIEYFMVYEIDRDIDECENDTLDYIVGKCILKYR